MIRFFDLHSINDRYRTEFQNSLDQFFDTGRYVLGSQVETFEKNFAAYCGTKYCVGTGNGLDALVLILKAYIKLGRIEKGSEVIVPANTYIASILAILQSGLKPVLVEPISDTFNIDSQEVKKAITSKTSVIMPVHLYGQLADMEIVNSIAKTHNLLVIEDAAQAHGAMSHSDLRSGNLANAAAFSFYPSKNLGALGDGGCVTTNDAELANMIKMLGNYGTSSKYVNEVKGCNSRLDEIQALFLNIKLRDLDDDNARRRAIANTYLKGITNSKIRLPYYSNTEDHVFHQFVIRVKDRDDLIAYLQRNNVETLVHYPIAPHHQKALKEFSHLSLPITEKMHNTVVSLPMYPTMTNQQTEKVIELLNAY